MQATPEMNPLVNLIPFALVFVIIYFLMLKPQKQREKEHQKQLASLVKNDEVVTSGGIHGTVVNVKDKTVIVRVDDNVKLEIEKGCIAHITRKGAV